MNHSEYNKRVTKLLRRYIGKLRAQGKLQGGKLSGEQAREFLAGIKKNGGGDSTVHTFNEGVRAHLRLLSLATLLAGGVLNQFVKGADVASRSHNLRRAIEALKNNDLNTATNRMVGDRDSLYLDLLDHGLTTPALDLKKWWGDALDRLRRKESFDSEDPDR